MQIEPEEITIQWKNADASVICAIKARPLEENENGHHLLDVFRYFENASTNRRNRFYKHTEIFQTESLIVDLTVIGDITINWLSTNRKLLSEIRSMDSNITFATLVYIIEEEIYEGCHNIVIKC